LNKKLIVVGAMSAAALAMAIPLVTHTGNVRAADAPPTSTPPATQPGDNVTTIAPPTVDPNLVVASAGDVKVTAGEVNTALAAASATGDPRQAARLAAEPDHGRKEIADELVTVKLLANAARKEKLQDDPGFKIREDQLLAQSLVQKIAEQKGADEKYFNDHKDYFDQVKIRHILIATVGSPVPDATLTDTQAKAKADDIKSKLDKGADFGKLATEESDDKQSALSGGELGLVSRGMMVQPFEDAAFGLKKNEISGPVKTQFGYHIIQLEDRVSPTFSDVQQQVAQRRVRAMIDQLSKSSPTTYNPAFITVAPTSQPATEPATQPAK
jgi:peptidyl-prolyl cis-trans isomerase C